MIATTGALRVGIFGPEEVPGNESRGCALWETGYAAAVRMAGGEPVELGETATDRSWWTDLESVHALIWTGRARDNLQPEAKEIRLSKWCRKNRLPLLAVDDALLVLNLAYEGTLYTDLCKECPEALQHRQPPEPGVRHALTIQDDSRLAAIYGEGELVVNSEHRRAINRVARGFRATAHALDGVIEAIEADEENWFAIGVQWRPAAATASGLDIQLFRGLIDAARDRLPTVSRRGRLACASAA
ncbi:MAG TPA: gamma-glutamyl-gamma-aminobutyrate hydrolase family protein [Gemmataceae bacterium]|nr:gamma-glutamyl-gamma-aminobutyrate hydrolase family protein [Gemmataceae bacterium]